MATVAARSPALQKLHWSENDWLGDDVVYTIAASCPLLQELCAENEYPSALTDAAVVALARGCPKLTMIEGLTGPALTDASVMALAQHCLNLETVHLQRSPLVAEAALTTLAQMCRELQRLYVCGSSINTAAVLRLRSVATDNGAGDEVVQAVGQEDDQDSDGWTVD
jgi:F-box/leucine-rich repeat protein 2/20